MIDIHEDGKGIAGEYNFEIAEQKVHEGSTIARHQGYPLKITMEKMV
jgi:ATP-dependent Clp protease adaptor protein ClpS